MVRLTLSVPAFILLCIVGGAFLGTVNPLGVSFGQRIAPQENVSIVSAILMGWAWCLASTVPSIVGELYTRLGHNATRAVALLSFANILMVGDELDVAQKQSRMTGNLLRGRSHL